MSDVTQSVQVLSGCEDYFFKVLTPNRKAFFETTSEFSSAINFATSLFHFHEWLFDEFKPNLEQNFNTTFSSKGKFWKAVEATNANFCYIRDVTNASKHVKIGGQGNAPTSTGMSHIANTHIVAIGYGQSYGQAYGGGSKVVFDDAGIQISFDRCAQELFDYWEQLLQTLTGKIFFSIPA
ncbi:MAG: hypothetical protein IH625_08070 [Rhodobacteraceae bacterium]|nr:hypothetical protein [Paracoccaceae bacterium]